MPQAEKSDDNSNKRTFPHTWQAQQQALFAGFWLFLDCCRLSNTFVLVRIQIYYNYHFMWKTWTWEKRPPKHGRNIGTVRAFTPRTPRTIYLYELDAELMASQSTVSPEPRAGWGLSWYYFIYCAPQELDGAPHDCCGCEFIPPCSGGALGLAYSAKITHPSRNCTKNGAVRGRGERENCISGCIEAWLYKKENKLWHAAHQYLS